jgi:hypothetical protein
MREITERLGDGPTAKTGLAKAHAASDGGAQSHNANPLRRTLWSPGSEGLCVQLRIRQPQLSRVTPDSLEYFSLA